MATRDRAVPLSMDTQQFVHLWKEALRRDPKDEPSQMEYLVDQCFEMFLVSPEYKNQNTAFLSEHQNLSTDAMKALVAKRVYSKCSNLRTKFKKAGYQPPDFPKSGASPAEKTIEDFASIFGLKPAQQK